MKDVKDQMKDWYLELENILSDCQNELDEVAILIKDKKYIAAFNYVDKLIDNNDIDTTEKFKDITTDLYLSLK